MIDTIIPRPEYIYGHPRLVGPSVTRNFVAGRSRTATDHRGKGPRSYQPSDERILDDICQRMTDSRYLDASEVNVDVNAGDVTLSGSVESRFEKRWAADLADTVYGVKNVENRIRIKSL